MRRQELFDTADHYKHLLETNKPYREEKRIELDNYIRILFTYSSNSIEGNTLTIKETETFLNSGITTEGKPVKEYHEVAGHAEAYDYILSVAKTKPFDITEDTVKRLHSLLYHTLNPEEAGQYRKVQVYISEMNYLPPKAEDVPHLMEHFINQMKSSKSLLHPIEYAAICHKRIVDIQPFNEGNGKVARLLMNLLLINAGYGVTSIPPELRD